VKTEKWGQGCISKVFRAYLGDECASLGEKKPGEKKKTETAAKAERKEKCSVSRIQKGEKIRKSLHELLVRAKRRVI